MAPSPLSQRPLVLGDPLYVPRPDVEGALGRALELGLNITVMGDAGAGKTTSVRQAVAHMPTPPDGRLIWIDARECAAKEVIDRIAEGFGWSRPQWRWETKPQFSEAMSSMANRVPIEPDPERIGTDDISFLASVIADAPAVLSRSSDAEPSTGNWLVVVDEPPSLAFAEVWGKHRERLWDLPVQWIVVTTRSSLPASADLFFDSKVTVGELDSQISKELITRRFEATGEVKPARAERLADAIVGQVPSRARDLIVAAREALLHEDDAELRFRRYGELTQRAALLGRRHAMLMAELIATSGAHASDQELQQRLGYSRPRIVQLLQELEEQNLVQRKRDGRRITFSPARKVP